MAGGLARFFGLRRTRPEPEPAAERVWYGPAVSGVTMTPEEALRLSAVWACVTVIAKALASCHWDVFGEDPEGNRTQRRETRLWSILNRRPNDEMTPFAWREAEIIRALVWGNAYSEIERDGAGRVFALWPLDPTRCQLERGLDGSLVLRVQNVSGPAVYLDYRDVYHLHGPSADGIAGYDTVMLGLRCLSQAKAAEVFSGAFYGNGTAFGGVLSTEQAIAGETAEQIRKEIAAGHQGPYQAFRLLLLGGGLSYQRTTVTPEEAQHIEQRQFMIEEVCRWFGVPPHKIAHLLRSTNNNIEHQSIEFVRDALTPWAERLRQEADWKLAPTGGRQVRTRLDTEWLAEGDAKSKAEADGALVNHGLMTVNEGRRRRGLNTIGAAGDRLLVQQQMVPIERAGEHVPPPPASIETGAENESEGGEGTA